MNKTLHAEFALQRPDFSLDVNFTLPCHGVTAIFGPSGSGKTTLLRCIAGLERTRHGRLTVGEDTWQSSSSFLSPHRRPIGFVFQEAGLFEHLDVEGNLAFAVKRAPRTLPKTGKCSEKISVEQAVALLDIAPLLKRRALQLSGGEQQRVAIARALLVQPQLLLMDEPLSSLDQARKAEILPYLESLKRELSLPILYVSHAADEVARLADHLLVMEKGRIVNEGPLSSLLTAIDVPLHLGDDMASVLDVRVVEREPRWHMQRVAFDGGELWLRDTDVPQGTSLRVRILARDISLARDFHDDSSISNILQATICEIVDDDQEGQLLIKLRIGDSYLVSRITARSAHKLALAVGQQIWAQIKSVALL